MLKIYPILFAPIILRHLGVKWGFHWLIGFILSSATVMLLSVAWTDWTATIRPIQLQLQRQPELTNWVLYGRLLPVWLAESSIARLGILAFILACLLITRPGALTSVLRRCSLLLIVFVNLAVFWSPQWLIWFLPLTVPLAKGRRGLTSLIVLVDLLNYLSFPVLFWILWNRLDLEFCQQLAEVVILIRTAVWFGLAIALLRDELSHPLSSNELIEAYQKQFAKIQVDFFAKVSQRGQPRGLRWVSCVAMPGEKLVYDQIAHGTVILQPMRVQFEPLPDSDMLDVTQARIPREVVTMIRWENDTWQPTERVIFNLTVDQLIAQSKARFKPVD